MARGTTPAPPGARRVAVMDFLTMRRARDRPKTRGSWLYGAGPFALIVVTVFLLMSYHVPYGWQLLITALVAVLVCPALVLLATVLLDRTPQ